MLSSLIYYHFIVKIRDPAYKTDVLCGVPYTALPLATVISVDTGVPMLIRRKEAKGYGTKKILEGNFRPGDRCLIVEDVVTSGSSVLETADILRSHGLVVDQAVVLLNREQGGEEKLRKNGITLHSLAPISQLMELLFRRDRVDAGTREKVLEFVRNNQVVQDVAEPKQLVEQMTLEDRRERADNTLTKKLLDIMIRWTSVVFF